MGDFRLHSYEAIHKWYTVVHLTLTFLQWRLYESLAQGGSIRSVANVMALHRQEHAREMLIAACHEARREADLFEIATVIVEKVVERFIDNPSQASA